MAASKIRRTCARMNARAARHSSPSERILAASAMLAAAHTLFEAGLRSRGFTPSEIDSLWRAQQPRW